MATWDELRAYIGLSYKVAEDGGELLKLLFTLDDGRSQLVLVARNDTGGGIAFATIASPFATVGQIDPLPVLTELSEYVVGGAVIYGDLWMVRHSVPLQNLDTNEFEAPLQLVLNTADALEKKYVGIDKF